MSHPNYVWYLQLLLLKIFLDNQKEKISAQPKVCLSFSPCKLQPYFDCVCWSLLPFFSPLPGDIHCHVLWGTSFTLFLFMGHPSPTSVRLRNFVEIQSQSVEEESWYLGARKERGQCAQSANPRGTERRVPLRNSILSCVFSRKLIFQELKR